MRPTSMHASVRDFFHPLPVCDEGQSSPPQERRGEGGGLKTLRGGVRMVLERVKPQAARSSSGTRRSENGPSPKVPVALSAEILCRIRPHAEEDSGANGDFAGATEERRIEVLDASTVTLDGNNLPFDKVIGAGASQSATYKDVLGGSIERAMEGESSCVIAIGPRGGGRSWTLTGKDGDFSKQGIVPRLASDLLDAAQKSSSGYTVSISCFVLLDQGGTVGVGKAQVKDLLAPGKQLTAVRGGWLENGVVPNSYGKMSEVMLLVQRASKVAAGLRGFKAYVMSLHTPHKSSGVSKSSAQRSAPIFSSIAIVDAQPGQDGLPDPKFCSAIFSLCSPKQSQESSRDAVGTNSTMIFQLLRPCFGPSLSKLCLVACVSCGRASSQTEAVLRFSSRCKTGEAEEKKRVVGVGVLGRALEEQAKKRGLARAERAGAAAAAAAAAASPKSPARIRKSVNVPSSAERVASSEWPVEGERSVGRSAESSSRPLSRASLDSTGSPPPRFGACTDVPTEAGELSKSDLEPMRNTQSGKETSGGGAVAWHSMESDGAAEGQGAGVAGCVHSPCVVSVPALAQSLAKSISPTSSSEGIGNESSSEGIRNELSACKGPEGDRRGARDGAVPRGEFPEDGQRGANDDEWDVGESRGGGGGVDGGDDDAAFDGHAEPGDDKGHDEDEAKVQNWGEARRRFTLKKIDVDAPAAHTTLDNVQAGSRSPNDSPGAGLKIWRLADDEDDKPLTDVYMPRNAKSPILSKLAAEEHFFDKSPRSTSRASSPGGFGRRSPQSLLRRGNDLVGVDRDLVDYAIRLEVYEAVIKYLQEAEIRVPNSNRPLPAGSVGPSARPPDLNKKERFDHLVRPASPEKCAEEAEKIGGGDPEDSQVVSINELMEDALTRRCIPLKRKALDIVLSANSPIGSVKSVSSVRSGSPRRGQSNKIAPSRPGSGVELLEVEMERAEMFRREAAALAQDKVGLEERAKKLNDELDEKKEMLDMALKELQGKGGDASKLAAKLDQKIEELDVTGAALNKYKRQCETHIKEKAEISDELAEANEMVERLRDEAEVIHEHLELATEDKRFIEAELTASQATLDDATSRKRIAELEGDVQELRERVRGLELELETSRSEALRLEEDAIGKDEELLMQSEAQLRLEDEIRKLRQAGSEGGSRGEARVRQLEIELQAQSDAAKRLRKRLASLEEEEVRAESPELDANDEIRARLSDAQAEAHDLRSRVVSLERDLAAAEANGGGASCEDDEESETLRMLSEQITMLERSVDESEQRAAAERTEMHAQVEKLRRERDAEAAMLRLELEACERRRGAADEAMRLSEIELGSMRDEVLRLEEELRAANAGADQAAREVLMLESATRARLEGQDEATSIGEKAAEKREMAMGKMLEEARGRERALELALEESRAGRRRQGTLEGALEQAQGAQKDLQEALEQARCEAQDAHRERSKLETQIQALDGQVEALKKVSDEAGQLRTDAVKRDAEVHRLTREVSDLRASKMLDDQDKLAIAQSRLECENLTKQVLRLESKLKAAKLAYETERFDSERATVLADETTRLAEENKALRSSLGEAQRRAQTAEGDALNVRVWEEQAVALADQLAVCQSELDAARREADFGARTSAACSAWEDEAGALAMSLRTAQAEIETLKVAVAEAEATENGIKHRQVVTALQAKGRAADREIASLRQQLGAVRRGATSLAGQVRIMGDVIKQMGDAVQAEGYAVGHLVKQVGSKDAAMKHAVAASAQAESDFASMRARKEAAERECLAARERCRELEGRVHLAQEANARAASAEERLRAMYEAARASADAEVHMAEDHQILKIELRQAKAEALEHKHALSSSIRDQERMWIAAMDLASQLESLQKALGTPVALRCSANLTLSPGFESASPIKPSLRATTGSMEGGEFQKQHQQQQQQAGRGAPMPLLGTNGLDEDENRVGTSIKGLLPRVFDPYMGRSGGGGGGGGESDGGAWDGAELLEGMGGRSSGRGTPLMLPEPDEELEM